MLQLELRHFNTDLFTMHKLKTYLLHFLFLFFFTPVSDIKALGSSPSHEHEEVVVVSLRNQRSFDQQPSRIEVLGKEEINEKGEVSCE